jgi:hypothetical protein
MLLFLSRVGHCALVHFRRSPCLRLPFSQVNDLMQHIIREVPSKHFLPLLYQVSSRLSSRTTDEPYAASCHCRATRVRLDTRLRCFCPQEGALSGGAGVFD